MGCNIHMARGNDALSTLDIGTIYYSVSQAVDKGCTVIFSKRANMVVACCKIQIYVSKTWTHNN